MAHSAMSCSQETEVESALRINEIFYSLQGETNRVGLPTVFIRTTGCPLRCHYCDTAYAFYEGQKISISDILSTVKEYDVPYVTVTGGEPLAQQSCLKLLRDLCDCNFSVSLETSGALDLSKVDRRVAKIMDLKTPSSGEQSKNLFANLEHITQHDQIKFVISTKKDYQWSRAIVSRFALIDRCEVLFSPVYQTLQPTLLADWILQDKLAVRFQSQLHKALWGDVPGH